MKGEEELMNRKFVQEEFIRHKTRQQEKELLEERMNAEIVVFKIEMQAKAKLKSKLPELKISPFDGTASDWMRFENMFMAQVGSKPISEAEKFGYLLEYVNPKVKARLSNLKPGPEGYKKAWERLKADGSLFRMETTNPFNIVSACSVCSASQFLHKAS